MHCGAGISRAGTACCVWLMHLHSIGRDEALARLKQRREWAQPNPHFMAQLAEYEARLKKAR